MEIHVGIIIVSIKILSSTTVFNIGRCDTEEWSNDAENSALPSQELNYIISQKITVIFLNISVFTLFLIKYLQLW